MSIYRRRIVKILVLALIVGSFSVPLRSASKSKKPYLTLTEVNFTDFNNAYSYVKNLKRSQIKKTTIKISDRNIATAKVSKKTTITIKRKSDAGSCYITVKVALKKKVQKKKNYTFTIHVYINQNNSYTSKPSFNPATTLPSYTPYTSIPSPRVSPSVSPSASASAKPSSNPSASPQNGSAQNRDPNEEAALRTLLRKYIYVYPDPDDKDITEADLEKEMNKTYFPGTNDVEHDIINYNDSICDFTGFHEFCEWENGHLVFLEIYWLGVFENAVISFESFPKLRALHMETNDKTNAQIEIDISKNKELSDLKLYIGGNIIKNTLDLKENTHLKNICIEGFNDKSALSLILPRSTINFECRGISVRNLDFSNATALKSLSLYETELSSINLSNKPNLEQIHLNHPGFSSIDLSGCPELKSFECYRDVSNLDFSNNSKLESLLLGYETESGLALYPELTHLDITHNTKLRSLTIIGTNINALDLSKNILLNRICFCCNKITSIDLSNPTQLSSLIIEESNLSQIDISNLTQLSSLTIEGTNISQLYLSMNTELELVNVINTKIQSLDLTNCTKLKELICDYGIQVIGLPPSCNVIHDVLYGG